jgi:hypothetical protein
MAKQIINIEADEDQHIRLQRAEGITYSFPSIRNAVRRHVTNVRAPEKDWEFWAVKRAPDKNGGAIFDLEVWPHTAGKDHDKRTRLAKIKCVFDRGTDSWQPKAIVSFKGHGVVVKRMIAYLEKGLPKPPLDEVKVFEVLVGMGVR